MTHIPGTGSLNSISNNIEEETNIVKPEEVISIVNIDALKNPTNKEFELEDEIWYFQLKYWLAGGFLISTILALASFWNWKAIFIIPLGPYVAYLTWYVRKWARKYSKNVDALH